MSISGLHLLQVQKELYLKQTFISNYLSFEYTLWPLCFLICSCSNLLTQSQTCCCLDQFINVRFHTTKSITTTQSEFLLSSQNTRLHWLTHSCHVEIAYFFLSPFYPLRSEQVPTIAKAMDKAVDRTPEVRLPAMELSSSCRGFTFKAFQQLTGIMPNHPLTNLSQDHMRGHLMEENCQKNN